MTLKIIGGEYGGRVLRSVKGFMTRPLLGHVREAVFNILRNRIDGAEVWDLFAGTGASGIEALSRGARRVLFVEKANQALSVLRANLDALGADAKRRSHVLKLDAAEPAPLRPAGEETEVPPDVVFYDPPYALVGEDPVKAANRAQLLCRRLAPGGVLCFHFMLGHLDRDDFDQEVDLRTWGRTCMAFLGRIDDGMSAGGEAEEGAGYA
jgi:16S rRNA (guanine966-N2)-methyltransferase